MSSPATSCSRRYTDSASTYCSRKRLITIASRNALIPRFSVYQLGRGSDPVIVVGNTVPAVAFNIGRVSSSFEKQPQILPENAEKTVNAEIAKIAETKTTKGLLRDLCDLCV